MLKKITSEKDGLFYVKDGHKIIGRISNKNEGGFLVFTKEPFYKIPGFGINKELLLDDLHFQFKSVIIFCQGKVYKASRKKFIEKGRELAFSGFTKLYLHLNDFEELTNSQYSLNFKEN